MATKAHQDILAYRGWLDIAGQDDATTYEETQSWPSSLSGEDFVNFVLDTVIPCTYSVRIGKKVPSDGVNLAYVNSPDITPEANLVVVDRSGEIRWNPATQGDINYIGRPDTAFVFHYDGNTDFRTDDIEVTDEFSLVTSGNQVPVPLYYMDRLSGTFDASSAREVIQYRTGYVNSPVKLIDPKTGIAKVGRGNLGFVTNSASSWSIGSTVDRTKPMVYLGEKISVSPLGNGDAYKIVLVPKSKCSSDASHANPWNAKIGGKCAVCNSDLVASRTGECWIVLYTNFRSSENVRYSVTYQEYDSPSKSTTRVLNPSLFFTEVGLSSMQAWAETPLTNGTWRDELYNKVYAIDRTNGETSQQYSVYVPSPAMIADAESRPHTKFKYQIEANLNVFHDKTRVFEMAAAVFENDASAYSPTGCSSLSSAAGTMPSHISLSNPMFDINADYENHRYWWMDIYEPLEILNKLDVLIIHGGGDLSLSGGISEKLITYISNGGKVWIDNGGSATDTLAITNWHSSSPTAISFDTSNACSGTLQATNANLAENYYLSGLFAIDIANIDSASAPKQKIIIPAQETSSWDTIFSWSNNSEPAMVRRNIGAGVLMVSNFGLFRTNISNQDTQTKLMVICNTLAQLGSEIYVKTPQISDQVIYINDLYPNERTIRTTSLYGGVKERTVYMTEPISTGSTTIIAKKILTGETVKDAISKYIPDKYKRRLRSATYTVKWTDMDGNSDPDVVMTPAGDGEDLLWAYTTKPGNISFSLDSTELHASDIVTHYPQLSFKWSITSYAYEWDNDSTSYVYREGYTYTGTSSVSSANGLMNIGKLATYAPSTLGGSAWTDKRRVFYKLWLGEFVNGSKEYSKLPINLGLYNPNNGNYVYDRGGELIFSSNSYTADEMGDIELHAWTDYSTVKASLRTFSVRQSKLSSISIANPASEDERDAWCLRIKNGRFIRTVGTDVYIYEVPEFSRQHFDPGAPYMSVNNDRCTYIDSHHLKLNYGNVSVGSVSLKRRKYMNSLVRNEELTLDTETDATRHTYTSGNTGWLRDPAPKLYLRSYITPTNTIDTLIPPYGYTIDYENGTIVTKQTYDYPVIATHKYMNEETIDVVEVDAINGIVTTQQEVDHANEIYADYIYEEQYYTYKGYWNEKTNQFIYLDLNPSEGHTSTLYGRTVPTSDLINKHITLYMVPYKVNGSVSTQWTIRHSMYPFDTVLLEEPLAVQLADIQIQESATVKDITVLDSRTRGGGLKTKINKERIGQVQPLSEHYWDIGPWNGIAYRSNAVVVIRLPKSLVEADVNGVIKMTDGEVRDKINKFLPLGVFPIIEYV